MKTKLSDYGISRFILNFVFFFIPKKNVCPKHAMSVCRLIERINKISGTEMLIQNGLLTQLILQQFAPLIKIHELYAFYHQFSTHTFSSTTATVAQNTIRIRDKHVIISKIQISLYHCFLLICFYLLSRHFFFCSVNTRIYKQREKKKQIRSST